MALLIGKQKGGDEMEILDTAAPTVPTLENTDVPAAPCGFEADAPAMASVWGKAQKEKKNEEAQRKAEEEV